MQEIICIFGATSSGKSELAVALAQHLDGEIVSTDSMQVYRGFDIGTGKIRLEERRGVPHHLLDICEATEHYSAGQFQCSADEAIKQIRSRKHVPILAGGTGLYFRAVLRGLAPTGPADTEVRERLRLRAERKGIAVMHRVLARLDPATADRLPEQDTQRILRALEYRIVTGRRMSDAIAESQPQTERYSAIKIGLSIDRKHLRERIDQRVDAMFESGWIDEVRGLLAKGIPENCQAMQAIGYREIIQYLRKEVALGEAKDAIKKATHQYAKRQDTWFGKEPDAHWLEAKSLEETIKAAIKLITERT